MGNLIMILATIVSSYFAISEDDGSQAISEDDSSTVVSES